MRHINNSLATTPTTIRVMPFPVKEYDNNPFYMQVGYLLGLGLCLATMYPLSRLTKTLVEEKETKLRELMKIMGLRDLSHQLSWFTLNVLMFGWIGKYSSVLLFFTSSRP